MKAYVYQIAAKKPSVVVDFIDVTLGLHREELRKTVKHLAYDYIEGGFYVAFEDERHPILLNELETELDQEDNRAQVNS